MVYNIIISDSAYARRVAECRPRGSSEDNIEGLVHLVNRVLGGLDEDSLGSLPAAKFNVPLAAVNSAAVADPLAVA